MLDFVGQWIKKNVDEDVGYKTRVSAELLREWIENVIETQFSIETKRKYVPIDIPKEDAEFLHKLFQFVRTIYTEFADISMPDDYRTMLLGAATVIGDFGRAAFGPSGKQSYN